jgi:BNR repeat-like domain
MTTDFQFQSPMLVCLAIFVAMASTAQEANEQPLVESFTAVPDATVWPNLTRLSDGTIVLAGFSQPSHGQVEGDVACWASRDEGETWVRRGTLTQHAPNTVRMNQAVGLDQHGNLIALVGGWTNEQQPGAPKRKAFRDAILRPWVCHSENGGKTWTTHERFPADPLGREMVAFGNIVLSDGGRLNASAYGTTYWDKPGPWTSYFLTSEDDGASWQVRTKIADTLNETALLYLGEGEWLAALRGKATHLYRSTNDGKTWRDEGAVAQERQYPAHLLRLNDGRILLTVGDRRASRLGVRARISSDKGKTWGETYFVAPMSESDGGYPASVERRDGKILTLFYRKKGDTYSAQAAVWTLSQ